MGTATKVGIVSLVLLVAVVFLVPGLGNFFNRLFTRSETITLPASNANSPDEAQQLEIVTLLGFDAIPAILNPDFITADEAERWMAPDEQVMGLTINGESRAYSIPMLSRHEIVNDVVGGVPVAVTW